MRYAIVLSGLLGVIGLVGAADGVVIIPAPARPFVAGTHNIIRIPAEGVPGVTEKHHLAGPARVAVYTVEDQSGRGPAVRTEYDLVPTGKGKVVFEVTTLLPPPKGGSKVSKYEFEVR